MATPIPDPQQWLQATLRTMQQADQEVIAILKQAQLDVNRMLRTVTARGGVGAAVRAEQLRLIKSNLQIQQADVWRRLGDLVRARRLDAAARSIQLSGIIDAVLLRALGKEGRDIAKAIADSELDLARGAMDRMIARVQGTSYVPLSQRVYQSEVRLGGKLDRMVNSALSRGLSAREFAGEVRQFINPFTPGGLRYAAMRLARTEINNAAHATAVVNSQDKPWLTAMQWKLSGSHPRPDKCDQLARGGPKGDGHYPKGSVPGKPHPQCFCFVIPVLEDGDVFLDKLVGGEYDGYLDRYRGLSAGQKVITRLG